MLPRDTHIPLIALQLFIDSVSSKESMSASHRQSAVKDGHQADVIILMQLNNPPPPGIPTAVISFATEASLHQTKRSFVHRKSHAVVVPGPGVVNFEKNLGVDVVEPTLLHLQAAIFMSEPLECFVDLEFLDFCRNRT